MAELNAKYRDGFLEHLDASQRGEIVYIPNPLEGVGKIFNLMPSRYALISGATGAGKTSFGDYTYVLAPWSYLQKNLDVFNDIHWEINYFSLERKQLFKHAKWVSWMMYRDNSNLLVSSDQILGWQNGPMNQAGYNLVRSYDDEMSALLEHVNLHDGKVNPKVVSRIIERRGLALGDLYKSDGEGVFFRDDPIYIARFSDENLVEQTKIGPKRYVNLEHKGVKFKLYEDDHRYFMYNKKTFVFFMIDGINLLGDKEIIDKISMELANARDIYGFSPVVITQQNRAMGDIGRLKLHGNDLSPQLEDIFKSSQMGFDADLIMGMFDPYRYKAYDSQGTYGGYTIKPMEGHELTTLTSGGFNRFRSLHILKNTFGPDSGRFGMKFLGECNNFEVLPAPDSPEMQKIYQDIRSGL